MSKYIIDTETWANLFEVQRVGVYGIGNDIVTDEKTVWSRMFSLDELEELNSDYINEHYGGLQDEAYQRGLEDAWEAAQKVVCKTTAGGMSLDTLKEIFGVQSPAAIMQSNTAQQAIDKIKTYEDKRSDRIEVGDEVTDLQSGANFVVTHLWKNNHGDKGVSGFNNDCSAFSATLDKVSKTGRHFDVDKILDEMKGNNDK